MKSIPKLSTTQMREVDRAMIEDYHIALIQMMENAGRNLAHLARKRFLEGNPRGKNVVILAGSGGNGGGGLVCARRLHNWGATVRVITTKPKAYFKGIPAHQLDILYRMQVSILSVGSEPDWKNKEFQNNPIDLIVDAVIGYSLAGAPQGTAAWLITWANSQKAPILSLDTPSGLDPANGTVYNPAIQATATLTLALPKKGLQAASVEDYVGELYLADISVPPGLYSRPGLELTVGPIFAENEIIRL